MRGLDDAERRVIVLVLGQAHPGRLPMPDEAPALHRLLCRRLVVLGPLCARCGLHPDIVVTSTGRDVEAWDRMTREGTVLNP